MEEIPGGAYNRAPNKGKSSPSAQVTQTKGVSLFVLPSNPNSRRHIWKALIRPRESNGATLWWHSGCHSCFTSKGISTRWQIDANSNWAICCQLTHSGSQNNSGRLGSDPRNVAIGEKRGLLYRETQASLAVSKIDQHGEEKENPTQVDPPSRYYRGHDLSTAKQDRKQIEERADRECTTVAETFD